MRDLEEIMSYGWIDSCGHGLSRRGFLARASAAAGVAATASLTAACSSSNKTPAASSSAAAAPVQGDRLVLLGTAGGPVWWPGTDRRGISSALVVNGAVYLVDCGEGAGHRLKDALLVPQGQQTPGGLWGMQTLRAIFLTHLHSDHLADYFNLFLYGWYNGLIPRSAPVKVLGPGRRGALEPVYQAAGSSRSVPPLMNPDNSTPGTVDMTNYMYQAFALDENDRMRDNSKPDLRTLMSVGDIVLPQINGFDPNTNPSPPMEPFKVFEDDNVRVTATLVNHFPIVPAFAYRFDTANGAVVFSGDTNRNDNLIRLAKDAEFLVHEVIDPAWPDTLFPHAATPADESLKHHLLTAHTPVDDVGAVAQAAGAHNLVLSHIVPGNAPDSHLQRAQNGYSGQLVIGRDLMQLALAGG